MITLRYTQCVHSSRVGTETFFCCHAVSGTRDGDLEMDHMVRSLASTVVCHRFPCVGLVLS